MHLYTENTPIYTMVGFNCDNDSLETMTDIAFSS